MAKKKVKLSNKITNSRSFVAEGILDCDNLQQGSIYLEVEDHGSVDLCEYIKQFGDTNVRITITNRVSEDIEQ